MKGHLQKLRDDRDGVNQTEIYDDDDDIDLAANSNPMAQGGNALNQSAAPQSRLQRQPDGVSQPNQAQNRGGGRGMDFGGDPMDMMKKSAPSSNVQRNGGSNQRGGGMDFGGDPMDMMKEQAMNFGGDPDADERDLARSMYG